MDPFKRPYVVPLEFYNYSENHDIFDMFQYLLERIVVKQPEDPFVFLRNVLKGGFWNVPQVFFLGPPSTERKIACSALCISLDTVHLSPNSLLKTSNPDLEEKVSECLNASKEIPPELWAELVWDRIEILDCKKQGWVLEGFPRNRLQCFALLKAGIFVSHVVVLDIPCISPVTPEVLPLSVKQDFDYLSPDQIQELQEHRRQIFEVRDAMKGFYNETFYVADIDKTVPQVIEFVRSRPRFLVPYVPRIIIIGPPGSGKYTQAKKLSKKYDLILVDCEETVQQAIILKTEFGKLAAIAKTAGRRVADNVLVEIISERLNRKECIVKGWVMIGFPETRGQAKGLMSAISDKCLPDRVIFLNADRSKCMERLIHRRFDPGTGLEYHLIYSPPPVGVDIVRMPRRPNDCEEYVNKEYNRYAENVYELRDYFSHVCKDDLTSQIDANHSEEEVTHDVDNSIILPTFRKVYKKISMVP